MGVRRDPWPPMGARTCKPRCQENETPARVSSGRNSSMIKGYVKGGSFVKLFFDVESIPSGRPRRRWVPGVASAVPGFLWVDSVDSVRNPPFPEHWLRKPLKMSRNLSRAGAGGFWVDSPVKRPDARKVPGCAPPYTFSAGEEPWPGVRGRPIADLGQDHRCCSAASPYRTFMPLRSKIQDPEVRGAGL